MFREEAKWLQHAVEQIAPLPSNNYAANLGSSTGYFRTHIQPHIQQHLVEPLLRHGWLIKHMDMKQAEGVDLVVDVTLAEFGGALQNRFALTICTNMLEHVENIQQVITNLLAVTVKGGYILITVPYKYKIHHDPIDNGLRPTPQQIQELFPAGTTQVVSSQVITIQEKDYYKIKKSSFPLWGYRERLLYYAGKRYKVSGILLRVVTK